MASNSDRVRNYKYYGYVSDAKLCDSGIPATEKQCEDAVWALAKVAGAKEKQALKGAAEEMPVGCSTKPGDWLPYYKPSASDESGGYFSPYYHAVCTGPGSLYR